MALGENIDNLSKDIQEYIRRSIDGYRLHLIENLSALLGDILCGLALSMLLFILLLFLLAAMVVAVAPHTGLLVALLLAAAVLAALATIVYLCRTALFVNRMVARLARLFFVKNGNGDE